MVLCHYTFFDKPCFGGALRADFAAVLGLCYYRVMRQFTLRVAEVAAWPGLVRVRCERAAPRFAPGQAGLALARLPGQPFGRLPLYPFHGPAGDFEFCVAAPGHPYAALAPGDEVDMLGPLGHGFVLPPHSMHLLLMAATPARLFSLIYLALECRLAVTMLAPAAAPCPALPEQVELLRGPLTAELADWADVIGLDLPEPGQVAQQIRGLRPGRPLGFIQALANVPMPCGTGACQACWTETGQGRKLACVDGPVLQW